MSIRKKFCRLILVLILPTTLASTLSVYLKLEQSSLAQVPKVAEISKPSTSLPVTGVWSKGGDLKVARALHTSTLLNDGRVLIVGGVGTNALDGPLASIEIYDPSTSNSLIWNNLHTARHGHSATRLQNGKVLIVGGSTLTTTLSSVEIYDPQSNSLSNAASLGFPRFRHAAVLLQDGRVLVTGGNGPGQLGDPVLSNGEIYNPATNSWQPIAGMNVHRTTHSSILLPDGQILIAGGRAFANIPTDAVERYNPATNTWQTLNSMSTVRADHSVTLLPNGKVLVAGGSGNGIGDLSSAELFDPTANAWTSTGSMSTGRSEHMSALLLNGKVLVVGGKDEGSSAELYDPDSNTWSQTVGLRADRRFAGTNLLPNGKVLLTGGFLPGTASGLTDLFDPSRGVTTGSKITFGSVRNNNNHDVFVMDPDGNNQTRLTSSLAYDDQPKWSPDGSKIVFMSGRDGNFEIYSMNADGSSQTRLTNNPAADGFPAWSPDGTKIVFVSGNLNDPGTFEIFTMNADGSNRTQLTNDSKVDGVPAWSPDSSKIVFMSGSSIFDPNSFEIFVMNADGSNRVRLTNDNLGDAQPSFSPNGQKIVFAKGSMFAPNDVEIFVMNADGSNPIRLTNNSVTDGFPAWSSDGTQIIFASGSVTNELLVEFSVMNSDGSHVSRLTNNSALDWFPNYKPGPAAATIQFSATAFSINEGGGSLAVSVTRTDNTATAASVNYATFEQSDVRMPCSQLTGSASPRCDYVETQGTLTFGPGETSKNILIPIINDSYAENSEVLGISLTNPTNATIGIRPFAIITIVDNETVNGVNPIDDTSFFVRQHYIDFLNREPDPGGFAFWTNEITSCGTNPQCTEVKRLNVSAAFFLSIEFQESAAFVYRLYKGVLGRQPTYSEFAADRGQIPTADGVTPNSQPLVFDFVSRAEFLNKYPAFPLGDSFIIPLLQNIRDTSGVDLTPIKSQLNQEFDACAVGGPDLKFCGIRIIQRVVDAAAFRQGVFRESFVWMEYAGYLRRGPSDPPDSNLDGYNFWLNKLNQFNGNYIQAEMIKAFISSDEYRHRFGP